MGFEWKSFRALTHPQRVCSDVVFPWLFLSEPVTTNLQKKNRHKMKGNPKALQLIQMQLHTISHGYSGSSTKFQKKMASISCRYYPHLTTKDRKLLEEVLRNTYPCSNRDLLWNRLSSTTSDSRRICRKRSISGEGSRLAVALPESSVLKLPPPVPF